MRFSTILGILLIGSFLQAKDCPQGDITCRYGDGYSVMEVEDRPRGGHNWLDIQKISRFEDELDDYSKVAVLQTLI